MSRRRRAARHRGRSGPAWVRGRPTSGGGGRGAPGRRWRGGGGVWGGWGVGGWAGALVLAPRGDARGLERWLALGAAGFGTSLVLFSLSRSLWLSWALL